MSLSIDSYIETALWSSVFGEDGTPMDSLYSIDDFTLEFLEGSQKDLDSFMEKARQLFTEDELNESPIEHDFWLTRNGHGAGFWDGDYENGDALTDICKDFGEVCLEEHIKELKAS
jgi:hypothetical protein